MATKSGVVFISFFVLLALISGIIGALLYSFYEKPEEGENVTLGPPSCEFPYTYEPLSHKCLYFIAENFSGRKEFSSAVCKEFHDGNLIEIYNEADQKGLEDFMSQKGNKDIWLGISFDPNNRLWRWPNRNVTAKYTNWSHAFENKRLGGCAVATFENQYAWSDSLCELKNQIFAVCEYYPILI